MLIAPELKNTMLLINRLEQLEDKNFKLFVRLLFDENGFIVSPIGKKQCVKIYIAQNHHLLVTYKTHRGKFDYEEVIANDADIEALAEKVKSYLKYQNQVVEHENCN